jgi:hypothetical protein
MLLSLEISLLAAVINSMFAYIAEVRFLFPRGSKLADKISEFEVESEKELQRLEHVIENAAHAVEHAVVDGFHAVEHAGHAVEHAVEHAGHAVEHAAADGFYLSSEVTELSRARRPSSRRESEPPQLVTVPAAAPQRT